MLIDQRNGSTSKKVKKRRCHATKRAKTTTGLEGAGDEAGFKFWAELATTGEHSFNAQLKQRRHRFHSERMNSNKSV